MLHIPNSFWVINSYSQSTDLGIIDFGSMNFLTHISHPRPVMNCFLALYDRDLSLGWVLGARFSEVIIIKYIDQSFVRSIEVRSPVNQIMVVPESDFFITRTPNELMVYNITANFSSQFLHMIRESPGFVMWQDHYAQLLWG